VHSFLDGPDIAPLRGEGARRQLALSTERTGKSYADDQIDLAGGLRLCDEMGDRRAAERSLARAGGRGELKREKHGPNELPCYRWSHKSPCELQAELVADVVTVSSPQSDSSL
jgi:hypothetical protein